jgi:putative oxidoreductase
MERFLGRYSDAIYASMRIIVGLLFACHGAQKLFGLLEGKMVPIDSLMGVGGVIELVGGLMMAVGFFAGTAAFLASGMMAVGYFMAHAPKGFWPILNHGELAVAYCFLSLASRGSGRFSVDAALRS